MHLSFSLSLFPFFAYSINPHTIHILPLFNSLNKTHLNSIFLSSPRSSPSDTQNSAAKNQGPVALAPQRSSPNDSILLLRPSNRIQMRSTRSTTKGGKWREEKRLVLRRRPLPSLLTSGHRSRRLRLGFSSHSRHLPRIWYAMFLFSKKHEELVGIYVSQLARHRCIELFMHIM